MARILFHVGRAKVLVLLGTGGLLLGCPGCLVGGPCCLVADFVAGLIVGAGACGLVNNLPQ